MPSPNPRGFAEGSPGVTLVAIATPAGDLSDVAPLQFLS
jgi:hypothetical protein